MLGIHQLPPLAILSGQQGHSMAFDNKTAKTVLAASSFVDVACGFCNIKIFPKFDWSVFISVSNNLV